MFNNRYVFIQARWLHFSFELVSTLGGKLSERDHDDAESESVGDTVNSGKRGIANAA